MPPAPQVTVDTLDIIVDEYEHGASIKEIATAVRLSTSTVWKYLARSGVARRPVGRKRIAKPKASG